ncbi:MAG: molybdenum cofactor guanylyltransferase [Acidobacteria bacterium]|nr:molybdenum cofactor guanylyltransferase [Acidobacteriota bacterium]
MKRYAQVAGMVLAGGQSSRMGSDKALLDIGGVPLLVRTARLVEPLVAAVTVVGSPERYAALGLRVIPDHWTGIGPLGGLGTALRASTTPWSLVVGCDLPYLTATWLDWFMARALASQADALLPQTIHGLEPLCAMYGATCAPVVAAAIEAGVHKVTDGLRGLAVQMVREEEWKGIESADVLFKNMNTPEDYAEVRAKLEGKTAK